MNQFNLTSNMFMVVSRGVLAIAIISVALTSLYLVFLFLLTTRFVQTHAVYLHAFQMTGNKDLNVPETFGFLRGQVVPFNITSTGGVALHAWHILPIETYQRHEAQLSQEPSGLHPDITSSHGFGILKNDPEALLVIHFHGAGGNMGSGYRVPNYKALSAAHPSRIHVLTFDYRGFGLSTGTPSESGLIEDALAVLYWALEIAKIPSSRILIFSQSLGTAVNMAVADYFSKLVQPIIFAGHILVAPFFDVPTLLATYKIAGTVPILSPVAKFPFLFRWLKSYIRDEWSTGRRMEEYIRRQESRKTQYRIMLIHAEDDYDIPWKHTALLYEHALNATRSEGLSAREIERHRREDSRDFGTAGRVLTWKTCSGLITERILKYGLHDVIMGDPVITLAVMEIFQEYTI